MAAVALEALVVIPAFAGIVALGSHVYERETARSEVAGETRRDAWRMALGSCRVADAGAALETLAPQSFGVGLEAAVRQGRLEPHLGERDVTIEPRFATAVGARTIARPLLLGGGVSQVTSRFGVACNTVTRVRIFTSELHDVFQHFQFLFGQ